MKAIITTTFEVDVDGWFDEDELTKEQRIKKLKEDLSDFSVFMQHFEYENLKDVNVKIVINDMT